MIRVVVFGGRGRKKGEHGSEGDEEKKMKLFLFFFYSPPPPRAPPHPPSYLVNVRALRFHPAFEEIFARSAYFPPQSLVLLRGHFLTLAHSSGFRDQNRVVLRTRRREVERLEKRLFLQNEGLFVLGRLGGAAGVFVCVCVCVFGEIEVKRK